MLSFRGQKVLCLATIALFLGFHSKFLLSIPTLSYVIEVPPLRAFEFLSSDFFCHLKTLIL